MNKQIIIIVLILSLILSGCVGAGISKETTISTNFTDRSNAQFTQTITLFPDNTFSFRTSVVEFGRRTNISPITGTYDLKNNQYILNYLQFGTNIRIELSPSKNGSFIDQDGRVWE
jgi:hypothetical protein